MTEQHDDAENVDQDEQSGERWAGTPRWVRVSLIVAGLVVLMVVILFLVGGDHGPGRHLP